MKEIFFNYLSGLRSLCKTWHLCIWATALVTLNDKFSVFFLFFPLCGKLEILGIRKAKTKLSDLWSNFLMSWGYRLKIIIADSRSKAFPGFETAFLPAWPSLLITRRHGKLRGFKSYLQPRHGNGYKIIPVNGEIEGSTPMLYLKICRYFEISPDTSN